MEKLGLIVELDIRVVFTHNVPSEQWASTLSLVPLWSLACGKRPQQPIGVVIQLPVYRIYRTTTSHYPTSGAL